MSIGDLAAALPWPVFACDDGKRPLVAGGFKSATRDTARILAQFERPGAALIGVPTGAASGLIAVDIDIKNGARGNEWLAENADALPETRTHKTRTGGLHLLFRVPDGIEIRNSASKLAPGVDVRGEGGYIIVPPSDGYVVADATEPAEMPRWLIRACLPPVEERPPHQPAQISDKYAASALAAEFHRVATAPAGHRNDTLNVAALKLGQLVGAGLLARSTVEHELAAAARAAGLDARETAATIKSGLDAGIRQPRDIRERQRQETRPAPETAPEAPPEPRAAEAAGFPLVYFDDIEPSFEAKDFVQGVLEEGAAAVVYGESNSGKTFWTTDLSLHVAAGLPWRGRRVEQGGVVYCALEGGRGFRNRVAAWKLAHDALETPVHFAAIQSSINLLQADGDIEDLIAAIRTAANTFAIPVKLVVVDTLSRALAGGDENSSVDMGRLVTNMDYIRAATGATVLFVHHSGKDQSKGARGWSGIRAAIDTEIEVRVDESGARVAEAVKQREMKKGDAFGFALEVIELGTNQHGEPVTTCLVTNSDDEAYAGASLSRRRLPQQQQRALEVLADLVAASGQAGHAGTPAGIPSVPEKWWRDRFYDRAMPGAEQKAKEKAYRRAADALISSRLAGMSAGRVWVVSRTFEGHDPAP